MTLLADRYIRGLDGWFDIATANPVEIRIRDAGPLRQQIAWAETCAMLSVLRHPLFRPLIDYGVASETTLFEAYAASGDIEANSASASTLVTHGSRFLDAHGVILTASLAEVLVRPIAPQSSAARARPVGVVLQPRRACEVLSEMLTASLHHGTTTVRVSARRGMGLRTLQTTVAHRARADGFVPVCPEALHRWPWLVEALTGRHLCLMVSSGIAGLERAAAARLLTSVALHSSRSHLCLSCERTEHPARGAIHLESMGVTTMVSMIYVDPDFGPSKEDVFEAARQADGSPRRFLAHLGARPHEPSTARVFTVHETPAPYGADTLPVTDATRQPARQSRIGSVVWRASSRATQLESRGRHAAASRLLDRAARVLEARGEAAQAARCWLQLGWMSRSRGALERALHHATHARRVDASPEGQVSAACLTAVCWTDQQRFVEAEASLRSLAAAAYTVNSVPVRQRCLLALARALFWEQRSAEAIETVEPLLTAGDADIACEAHLLTARSLIAHGEIPDGIRCAREAATRAAALSSLRLRAISSRIMAEAVCTAGDVDAVRTHVATGLQAAAAARLPLLMLRLRAVLMRALCQGGVQSEEIAQLGAVLARARRLPLPPLTRRILDAATAAPVVTGSGPRVIWPSGRSAVEDFLEVAQRAKDDAEAVARVVEAVCERLAASSCAVVVGDGRVVAVAGRPWRDRSLATRQAQTTGCSVPVDTARQPPEAGEPIRCGGDLIGAIGCRWAAGAPLVPAAVSASLRAAAAAVATHLRSVVESVPLEPPPSAYGDLLGASPVAVSLREAIHRAARAPFPVLVEGESGSGKELVARAIHKLSPRHVRRFCAINCAALTDELVEAELFGHARGAFTGAAGERPGLFEEADGGTLFLDEVGELSARAQAKLLRVLQEGEVRRVGENLPRRVDVRIVAATNRRLEQEAAGGRFRVDLRFRLDVLRIAVPPLRERVADIPLLAQHFWRQATNRLGSNATLSPEALAALSRHDWPGNVRELQNAIAWMAVHAPRRGRVGAALLPAYVASGTVATGSFEAAREEFERRFVRAALAQAGGQRQIAARALGMSRQGLAKMMRRLRIETSR